MDIWTRIHLAPYSRNYSDGTAHARLDHNITEWHVSDYGDKLEIMGAAAELAARILLGLDQKLHVHFDGGVDFLYHGWRVDVKSTELHPDMRRHNLQWPEIKEMRCDIVMVMVVDLAHNDVYAVGWAWAAEILGKPVNHYRPRPCREVPYKELHAIKDLKNIVWKSRSAPRTDRLYARP